MQLKLCQFYRRFNANQLQSRYKFPSSVIFSVQFDYGDYMSCLLEKLKSDRDGEKIEIFFFD